MNKSCDTPFISVEAVNASERIPSEVDLVVIGGGIVGVCTAFFAAKEGIRVCICEKGEIAAEQSSRNWGWTRQMGRDPVEMPLSIKSLNIWRNFKEDFDIDVGFRQTGITYLCRTDREIEEAEKWAKTGEQYQLAQKKFSNQDIKSLFPGISSGIRFALNTKSDGRAEPTLAVPAIAKAAKKLGVSILTGHAVRGIETSGGRISSVITEFGRIKCTSTVLASGAWTRLFLGNIGINFPQLKILGTAARAAYVNGAPDMPVGSGDFAFRKRLDGGFTIALRNTNIAPIVPDSFRLFPDFLPTFIKSWRELKLRIGHQFLQELQIPRSWPLDKRSPFEHIRKLDPKPHHKYNQTALNNLKRAFPVFEHSKITHSWAGLIDVTPDGIPAIGPIPSIPGLFISSGFSGHGFGIGPGAGKLTAQLVTGSKPLVDPKPFRFDRFSKTNRAGFTQKVTATGKD